MEANKPFSVIKIYMLVFFCLLFLGGCAFQNSEQMETAVHDAAKEAAAKELSMERQKGGRTRLTKHPEVSVQKMSVSEYAAQEYLKDMSVEQKINQMIFLHYQGQPVEQLKQYQPGGIILFADFFKAKSRETVIADIAGMQKVCEIPMLVGVDEEGGTVIRVSRYRRLAEEKFRSPQELYAAGGMEEIVSDTEKKAALLRALGINVNLAPVADVSVNASDYIYQRTFGKDARETAQYAAAVVAQMKQSNIGSVLKHFPGYGNNRDTHKGFAVDNREYADFEAVDFLPFEAGIAAGADSVLVSHNIVTCMDERLPASLSPAVHDILRQQLQFTGVIMTDDLAMDAIAEADFEKPAAVLSVLAGNDMIITTDYKSSINALREAVEAGEISEQMIDEAVLRILIWKMDLGLMEAANENG